MKVSKLKVYALEDSIIRAKYPMSVDIDDLTPEVTKGIENLGKAEKGSGHDNFLNGIIVQFDLTCSNKMWVEMERYHFVDFISSQSTMHRITEFKLNNTYNKYTSKGAIRIMQDLQNNYKLCQESLKKAKDKGDLKKVADLEKMLKTLYYELLYSNPAGFELTAGLSTNYRQLKTIYGQRKNHRLDEWQDFCKVLESLPHSEWITGKDIPEE